MPLRFAILFSAVIALLTPVQAQAPANTQAATRIETFEGRGSLPTGWSVVSGDWKQADGVLLARSMESDSYITFGDPSWKNYEVEATVTFLKVRDPARWVSLLVRASEDGQTPWSQVPE